MQRPRTTGDKLGHRIHISVRHSKNPPHVPDRSPGRHGTKGDNLGHMVGAIFFVYIINDLLPAADTEVNINIGHGYPLWVEKSLKIQGVLHGVQVCDIQAVRHHGAGSRPAPRSHRDVVSLGKRDKVGHNKEIIHKAHLTDHIHLVSQLLPIFLRLVRIAACKAIHTQLFKVRLPVCPALWELKVGQVIFSKLKFHITQFGNFGSVLQRLRIVGEQCGHLIL